MDEELKYLSECKKATDEIKKGHYVRIEKDLSRHNGKIYEVGERWQISKQIKKYRCLVCGYYFFKDDPKCNLDSDEMFNNHILTHFHKFGEKQKNRLIKKFNLQITPQNSSCGIE